MTAKKSSKSSARAESASIMPFTIARFGTSDDASFKSVETLMSSGKSQLEKIANEATSSGREQFEAIIKSSTIFFKGVEEYLKVFTSLAQDSAEKNSEAVKNLMACKTINELTETQNRIAQKSFDEIMTNATRLSELSIKLATETFEPINAQLTKSIRKASDALAAA